MNETTDVAGELKHRLSNSSSLLDAIGAAGNWRAFVLLVATFFIALLVATALGAMTANIMSRGSFGLAGFMSFMTILVAGGITLVGINAVGIMLGDEVWGRDSRGITDSVLASLFTTHRLILVLLIEAIIFVVYLLVLWLLLFICKTPSVGPLLYALVFPVGALATGFLLFALFYIGAPLAAPAIWNGEGVMRTLAVLKEVAQRRLFHVIILFILLGLMTGIVMFMIWWIVFSGAFTVLTSSAAVVGIEGGGMGFNAMSAFGNLGSALMGGGGGSGYAYALSFGFAILALVASVPGALIGIKGVCIVYREVTAGLSVDEVEAEFQQKLLEARQKAAEAKRRATAIPQAVAHHPQPLSAAAVSCPACGGSITSDDVFCGSCGHKLK